MLIAGALKSLSGHRFFWFIIFLGATDVAMLLDIPVLRQLLVFILLSILPGWVIIHLLRLDALGLPEKAVLSVGLSTFAVTFVGLIMNSLYPLFGYDTPLSATSLTITLNIVLLLLAALAFLRRGGSRPRLSDFNLDFKEKAFLIVPALFPLLSIIGIVLMNTGDNNTLLMTLLVLIPLYVVFLAAMHSRVPPRVYPLAVILISASILLAVTLRNHHIMGVDIHREYYLFQLAADAQHWRVIPSDQLSSCLVISLLPAIYQPLINMDPEYLFNILHLFTTAFSPLVVFIISRKYIGNAWAFLAAFFFMAQLRFLAFGGGRNDYAVFYFALLIMVLFHEKLSDFNKKLLFIFLAAGLIISHYSATFIAIFVLVPAWAGFSIFQKFAARRRRQPLWKSELTFGLIAIFIVLTFLWDSQLTHTAFAGGVEFVQKIFNNLARMFILESRSQWVGSALGIGLGGKGVPHRIEFITSWLTIAFIAAGILVTLLKYRDTLAWPGHNHQSAALPARRIDPGFLALTLTGGVIMAAAFGLPFISRYYDIGRVFFQMMPLMVTFFVIGGIYTGKFLRDRRVQTLMLVLLAAYFACTSGAAYQMFGYPRNLVLNSTGEYYEWYYIHDQESRAARWLGENGDNKAAIYTEHWGIMLVSQGKFPQERLNQELFESYLAHRPINGYVYLRYENVVNGKIMDQKGNVYRLPEYPDFLTDKGKIYVSNGAEIFQ